MKLYTQGINKKEGQKGEYYALTLKDEEGAIHKVNMFSNHPEFATLKEGDVFEDEIEEKGQWKNLKGAKKQNNFRGAQIEKAQATKAMNIKEAQDEKKNSIMISSTARDATLMVTTFYSGLQSGLSDTEIQLKWKKWRLWLLNNWDVDYRDTEAFPDDDLPYPNI